MSEKSAPGPTMPSAEIQLTKVSKYSNKGKTRKTHRKQIRIIKETLPQAPVRRKIKGRIHKSTVLMHMWSNTLSQNQSDVGIYKYQTSLNALNGGSDEIRT